VSSTIKKINEALEEYCPNRLSAKWDNTGFILGSESCEASRVIVALEASHDVLRECVECGCDMIITHHPPVFTPLSRITDSSGASKLVYDIIRSGVGVYSMHTNLDSAVGGTNDFIAELLGLSKTSILEVSGRTDDLLLSFYVPEDDERNVSDRLFAMGAGKIGNYSGCSFSSTGKGSFMPEAGARPAIGTVGNVETVSEKKVEMILSEEIAKKAVQTLIASHPYETVAYSLTRMTNGGQETGIGVICDMGYDAEPVDFARMVKARMELNSIRLFNSGKRIRKVGICTGSGASLISLAHEKGCDILLTGDVKHHDFRLAEELGISVIDFGHFESENIYMKRLAADITRHFDKLGIDVEVCESRSIRPPYETL
jgi:dinuclear metal center YbgI/SA1388 family protein